MELMIQGELRAFHSFGGTASIELNLVERSAGVRCSYLRPADGTLAVTRHIASPFEALPGAFRFSFPDQLLASVLPEGVTELMRNPSWKS